MCFKKPKAPAKTAEELSLEQEARQERENAKLDLANQLAKDKQARTEDKIAQVTGGMGPRSLISGWKGGMGYLTRSLIG
jgi:hypothetical protein